MRRIFPLVIVFAFLMVLVSYGQELTPGEAAQMSNATVGRLAWFIPTSLPQGIENPVTVMTGKDLVSVSLSKRSPSTPVMVPADGILKVVRKMAESTNESEPEYLTIARIVVPEGVSKALIILSPAAQNAEGIVFDARAQDLEKFRGGDSMYINMTAVKIGIELGDEKTQVEPGETRILTAKTQDKPTSLTIRYFFHHPKKEEWRILSASTVAIYPTRREICIFNWDTRYKRIDYHGITFTQM